MLNDDDPDGDPLSAAKVADPTNGIVVLAADGSFTYTPNANFYGTDWFVYEVSDDQGGTDTATVTITVNPVIDAVIDIKPGNDTNTVKLHSNGVLPVAILTTSTADGELEDFDATSLATLDLKYFEFGDAREGYPRVHPLRAVAQDVDGDGDFDLLLHFSMREIAATGALDSGSVDAVLTAEFGGSAIGADLIGYDTLRVAEPKPKGKSGRWGGGAGGVLAKAAAHPAQRAASTAETDRSENVEPTVRIGSELELEADETRHLGDVTLSLPATARLP